MIRSSVRITACALAAALMVSGNGITASAAASTSVLPSGGIALATSQGNKLENITTNNKSRIQIECKESI